MESNEEPFSQNKIESLTGIGFCSNTNDDGSVCGADVLVIDKKTGDEVICHTCLKVLIIIGDHVSSAGEVIGNVILFQLKQS